MNRWKIALVVPVYNRPNELKDLLESLCQQQEKDFALVVVEDGSTIDSEALCEEYSKRLNLTYLKQANTGPAVARNRGVDAVGDTSEFVLFVDSDCTLPPDYIAKAYTWLATTPRVDLWGGPDAWDANFSPIQKAISYAMTSPFSTGGIRGGSEAADKFYPRTFNMGVRTEAFHAVGGFANLRYGEDVDLSMRLIEAGYQSHLSTDLYLFHKRRTSWTSFFRQVAHSGAARYELTKRHPGTLKLVHVLPSLAMFVALLVLLIPLTWVQYVVLGGGAALYALVLFAGALRSFRSFGLALRSMWACAIMLLGYGWGLALAWMVRKPSQEK